MLVKFRSQLLELGFTGQAPGVSSVLPGAHHLGEKLAVLFARQPSRGAQALCFGGAGGEQYVGTLYQHFHRCAV
jgi:hypothetical protein